MKLSEDPRGISGELTSEELEYINFLYYYEEIGKQIGGDDSRVPRAAVQRHIHLFGIEPQIRQETRKISSCCHVAIKNRKKILSRETCTDIVVYNPSFAKLSKGATIKYLMGEYEYDSGWVCTKCDRKVVYELSPEVNVKPRHSRYLFMIGIPDSSGGLGGYLVTAMSEGVTYARLKEKLRNFYACKSISRAKELDCPNRHNCQKRGKSEKARAVSSQKMIGETSFCSMCPPYGPDLVTRPAKLKEEKSIAMMEELNIEGYLG